MIKMLINNEEVISNRDFEIVEELLNTSSTILNNCYPKSWEDTHDYVSNFYCPADYSVCKILKDNELIFCGIVKNSGSISLRPTDPKYCSLQILDFKALLSEGTLDFVISNKTIIEAIEMVVNAIQDYGFVLGNINISNPDDIIGAYSTLEKSAYDVFQYLADISQSKWTTRRLNENILAIDFFDPLLVEKGTQIDYTAEWFEENKIENISYSFSTRDYRNKQIMISNKVYASIDSIETIISNGYSKEYTTEQNIGKIKSILLNGIEKTVITKDSKNLGATADFYYKPGENTFESSEILTAGNNIEITYVALVEGRQIILNSDEIDRVTNNMNRKGIITRYENRNDVLSSMELQKVGEAYMKYKGTPDTNLIVTTLKNIWEVGEVIYFNAPINEIKKDYMVKKKTTKYISSVKEIFYTYELSSSFNDENAINYFDNQRNKTKGNISAGEYISRNIDVTNIANIIFDNLLVEEIEISDNNVLDCTLDSPFNN